MRLTAVRTYSTIVIRRGFRGVTTVVERKHGSRGPAPLGPNKQAVKASLRLCALPRMGYANCGLMFGGKVYRYGSRTPALECSAGSRLKARDEPAHRQHPR